MAGRSQRDAEFVAFVETDRARLLAMARLLTAGDEAWAEDVVQTALTRLYLRWSAVRRAGNRLGYARTVLTRAFIDEARRAHRRRERVTASPVEGAAAVRDPDADLRSVVLAAVARLPPGQRSVIVLRHWLDYDVRTTAQVLGCSAGTVKSQNARALAHLREALDPVRVNATHHQE